MTSRFIVLVGVNWKTHIKKFTKTTTKTSTNIHSSKSGLPRHTWLDSKMFQLIQHFGSDGFQ